jgi:DNA-binding NarL/FixJ family response regulator
MQRILIVDDNEGIRALLARHFGASATFTVCASVATGAAARQAAAIHQPTGIVLDLSLPDIWGSLLIPELRASCPSACIVVYSADPGASTEAATAGADGFVAKGSPLERLDAVFGRSSPRTRSAKESRSNFP